MPKQNKKNILLIFGLLVSLSFSQENRLFWDGGDWKRVEQTAEYHPETGYAIKAAYVNGIQDGRLFYYLKNWADQKAYADSLYSDTVDYLTTRELVKSLDDFYADPYHVYIPVISAVIIVNMYGEQMPPQEIESYIQETKFWINQLMLDLEKEGATNLLDDKLKKHNRDK